MQFTKLITRNAFFGKYSRRRLPSPLIRLRILQATEDLDGRISFNAILLAQIRLLCTIDLGQRNALLLELGCRLLVLGRQSLAVAAPRREELREHEIVRRDEFLEGIGLEVVDVGGRGERRGADETQGQLGEAAHGGDVRLICDLVVMYVDRLHWDDSKELVQETQEEGDRKVIDALWRQKVSI